MADLEKIVKIIFAGDDSDLAKTITSVGGGMDALGVKVTKATQPLADLTDSVIKIDAVLGALAAGALVVAVNAAGRFGDSFAEISTLIDVPKDKLNVFSADILNYARDSTQSIEDINSAIYNAISSGEDYTTSLALLRQAENLGIATKADLNTAINILKPTMNAFGVETDQAADFADILFTTVKNGKTTLSELEPVLSGVTGVAASGGISFSDLSAAIAGLTASGAPTAQAVTQIRSALVAILAPTDSAKKAAAELGVSLGAEAIEAHGLDGVFRNLYEATGGNIEKMKELIPRIEGVNAAVILGKDASGKYSDALLAMAERTDAASIAYEKMKDNFTLINQQIVNNLKATLIDVGTPLLDEWGKIAEGIINIFKGASIGFDDGAFDPLIEFIEKIAVEIADEFEGIAAALPEALAGIDWSEFTQALDELVQAGKDLFKEMFGGIDLKKPEDLQIAIQKVIDTLKNWIDLTKGIVEGLGPFVTKIAEIAGEFSKLDGDTVASAGNILGWGKAINTVADSIPLLTAPLYLLSGAIGLLSFTQIPGMISALPLLGTALTGLGAVLGPVTLAVGAFFAAYKFGEVVGKDIPILGEAGIAFGNLGHALFGTAEASAVAMENQAAHTQELAKAALEMVKTKESMGELAEQLKEPIDFKINSELTGFFAEVDLEEWKLKNLEGYDITVTADSSQAEEELKKVPDLWNKIILEDGTIIEVPVEVDSAGAAASAQEAKDKIDEKLPSEKLMEIKLQGEIDVQLATIAAQAETLQTMFEWDAKVEIAGIEAAAEELVAVADLVGIAWQSTGDVISSALGVLSGFSAHTSEWNDIMDIIEKEQDIRAELAKATIELTLAQTALIKARAEAIANGEGMITITTEGLEPALEQVLYSIVQKAQIKANEEGFNALLGI